MTELERAQKHLRKCQEWLADGRRFRSHGTEFAEENVLAALSRLWEAQKAAGVIRSCSYECGEEFLPCNIG
jgi:hypothetical protein